MPDHGLQGPKALGLSFDFAENGSSFLENALGKAMALYELTGMPVLADDSGLCVDALDGRPGIYSARYGSGPDGVELPSDQRNQLLLAEMRGQENRACRFVCCLVVVLSPWRVFTVQESCEGILLEEGVGGGGFGYDPVVFLPELGKTVAQLDMESKNRVSHRGRALARMKALLDSLRE